MFYSDKKEINSTETSRRIFFYPMSECTLNRIIESLTKMKHIYDVLSQHKILG